MFTSILRFSQNFVNNLFDFANSIINFFSYEFVVGNYTYTLFDCLFSGVVVAILTISIAKWFVNLFFSIG